MNNWQESADFILSCTDYRPNTAIILGSGLGAFADEFEGCQRLSYEDIPGFSNATAPGHEGILAIGTLRGKQVCALKGRFHYYEGHSMQDIAFPIRVLSLLGIKNVIITCAVGGINKGFSVGDLMVITDHIKFFDESPLRGANIDRFGERFPDMTYAYSPDLIEKADEAAYQIGLKLQKGVYAYMSGPSYETPAEIRALSIMGADCVGMSTVPEVITAVHAGIRTLGIACISNMAAGILPKKLSMQEVLDAGEAVRGKFASLLKEIISSI